MSHFGVPAGAQNRLSNPYAFKGKRLQIAGSWDDANYRSDRFFSVTETIFPPVLNGGFDGYGSEWVSQARKRRTFSTVNG